MGVIGMKLNDDVEVVGMQMDTQGEKLLIVSENGMGKRTPIDEFTPQKRGGKDVYKRQRWKNVSVPGSNGA